MLNKIKEAIFPYKDVIEITSYMYNNTFPKFLRSIDPRNAQNRYKFTYFSIIIALQIFSLCSNSWLRQFYHGVHEALEEDMSFMMKAIMNYIFATIIENSVNAIQVSMIDAIIYENQIEAQMKSYELNENNHHSDISSSYLAQLLIYKNRSFEQISVNLPITYVKSFVNLIYVLPALYSSLPAMEKRPYSSYVSYVFCISGFPLFVGIAAILILNIIPNMVIREFEHTYKSFFSNERELYEDVLSLEENKDKYKVFQTQKEAKSEFQSKIQQTSKIRTKYFAMQRISSLLGVLTAATTTLIGYVLVMPYFKAGIVSDSALPQIISSNLYKLSQSIQVFVGSGKKDFVMLKQDGDELENFRNKDLKMNDKRKSYTQERIFSQKTNHVSNSMISLGDDWFKQKKDLTFESGKVYKVNAPSGTGKSSVLNAIAGKNLIISSSEMKFKCQNELDIFYLSQEQTFECATKKSSMGYFLLYGVEESENNKQKAMLLLERLKFSDNRIASLKNDFHETIVLKTLSGGEIKKLAFVNALLKKPKILLLDEVFAGVDKEISNEMKLILKEYLKENPSATIIYVEHEDSKVQNKFADQVIELLDYFKRVKNSFSEQVTISDAKEGKIKVS